MTEKKQKEFIIDVDIVIDRYNEKNPEKKPLTRSELAKALGVNKQLFTDWKGGRTPKLIYMILKLMEIGKCQLNDLLTEKTSENE